MSPPITTRPPLQHYYSLDHCYVTMMLVTTLHYHHHKEYPTLPCHIRLHSIQVRHPIVHACNNLNDD